MAFLEPVTRARQGPGLTEMRVLMNLGRKMLVRVGKLKDTKSGGFPLESRRV